MKYNCPSSSTWKLAIESLFRVLKVGLVVARKHRKILLIFIYLDVGRVTYAEMFYRTNLFAYVPADHVTGLASNVGK